MSFLQEISEEQLQRDHRSQMLGGTDMYTLMGHGYLEKGESHLDAIMAVWEKKRGYGTKPRPVNEAMRTGVEQEPAAYQRVMDSLAQGKLPALDERYKDARLFEPFRGLRIQRGSGDGYGLGGNMDAPLFDVSGEYEDPVSGSPVSGETYARRYAEEHAKIQLQHEVNRARELDGEEPWPVSEAKYKAPPFAGVIDIKVTQSASVYFDEIFNGINPRFAVQTHHYLEVLREESRRLSHPVEKDPELLGVYRFCLENNKTRFHEIEYDPELVVEMHRRAEIFTEKCLKQGIPPNSSALRDEFYVYPVKGTEPEAQLPSPEDEEKFKGLLDKHDALKERQKAIKGYENNLKEDLGYGVRQMGGFDPEDSDCRPPGVFVDGRIVSLEKKITNRKVTNEAAINGALLAGGDAKGALSAVLDFLGQEGMSAEEKLSAISQAVDQGTVDRLPREGAQLEDYQSTQRVESSQPTVVIKDNKNTRSVYQELVADRDSEDGLSVTKTDQPVATTPEVEVGPTEENIATPGSREAPEAGQKDKKSVVSEQGVAEPESHEVPEEKQPHREPEAREQEEVSKPGSSQAESGEYVPPSPAQHQPLSHERLTPSESRQGAAVSTGEPLEETPVNDDIEVLHYASPHDMTDAERSAVEVPAGLEGLASKPEPGSEAKGPDLLGGVVPDELADQALPEDLFGEPDGGGEPQENPGGAEEKYEPLPGVMESPFV